MIFYRLMMMLLLSNAHLQGDFYGFQSHCWFAGGKLFVPEINVNLIVEDHEFGWIWDNFGAWFAACKHVAACWYETTSRKTNRIMSWFVKSIINQHQSTIIFYTFLHTVKQKQLFGHVWPKSLGHGSSLPTPPDSSEVKPLPSGFFGRLSSWGVTGRHRYHRWRVFVDGTSGHNLDYFLG